MLEQVLVLYIVTCYQGKGHLIKRERTSRFEYYRGKGLVAWVRTVRPRMLEFLYDSYSICQPDLAMEGRHCHEGVKSFGQVKDNSMMSVLPVWLLLFPAASTGRIGYTLGVCAEDSGDMIVMEGTLKALHRS